MKSINTESLKNGLSSKGYYADTKTSEALNAAMQLKRPLLIEGDPGVGKTSLASALAESMGFELIRLQMYEGLTDDKILYDYDYTKQMLCLEAVKKNIEKKYNGYSADKALAGVAKDVDFYQEDFLIERPVLRSISGDGRKVLLIDEIDKAPEELEYMFYEFFEDYSISIPQLKKKVTCPKGMEPVVILTSNGYRELSEALKRRCVYLFINQKTQDEMTEIIQKKTDVDKDLAKAVAAFLDKFRNDDAVRQKPSLAEGIDWAGYLKKISVRNRETVTNSLGVVFKNENDLEHAVQTVKKDRRVLKGLVTIETP